VPLRKLVGKTSEVVGSSDDDEPLSASLRRPTFKETGLLQPQKHKSGVITVSSIPTIPGISDGTRLETHNDRPEKVGQESSRDGCLFQQGDHFTGCRGFTVN